MREPPWNPSLREPPGVAPHKGFHSETSSSVSAQDDPAEGVAHGQCQCSQPQRELTAQL